MKKRFAILSTLLTITAMAQTKGTFKTHDFDNFRLHVYHTNDALGDASYIVEGTQAVVTLEQPLFRENVAEYDAYLDALGQARRSAHRRLPCGRDRRPRDGHARRDARLHEGCGLRRHDAELRADLRRRDRRSADGSDGRVAFGTTQRWRGFRSVSTAAPRPTFLPRASSSAARSATPTGLPRRHTRIPCKSPRRQPSTPRSPRPVGARIGRRALHRRTRRSSRGRCRALQDRLSGMRETTAGRKRDGRRIRPCIASSLSGTPGRSGTGCIGAGALRRPITIPPP